ncbi:hypothetical protein ASPCAL01402 [Aspergillus calidoustus]|uniref:DUF7580 domain-containing protein n=1 Tax=Aspergillus calidoustus TaxID=454130 RepID=A0A0U5FQQ6_ASPCI|nr:hypothetical protein ASPCAL01402 [Aspergillus calidoustus]
MSGVEVAGLILGAIPIVVAALKTYKETKQRYIWFMSKEAYIDRLIQSLNEQVYFIKSDVEVALRSTDLEPESIKSILTGPDLSPWNDHEVADAIREYLGEGFELYLDALGRCQATICTIIASLNGLVSGTSKIVPADLVAIIKNISRPNGEFEFRKKIKFALQKEDIDAQIKELEATTKILSRINKQSTRKEAVSLQASSRAITKFASTLATIRDSAQRLYSAISRGYLHTCHDQHEVQLYLQTRSTLIQGTKPKTLKKSSLGFEVAFCVAVDAGSNHDAWSYKTEIQVTEREDVEDGGNRPPSSSPLEPNAKPAITFSLTDQATKTTAARNDIHDLCSLLHSTSKGVTVLDIRLFGNGKLCSVDSPATTTTISTTRVPHPKSFVTLTELISGAHPTVPDLNHRIALSYNVVSAVMQLHSTSWLTLPLASSSIHFIPEPLKTHKQPGRKQKYLPFIKAVFESCTTPCTTCHYSTRDSMLELGILLFELWHAQSIEVFAADNGLKLTKSFGSRYEVAQKWIAHSEDEGDMMPFYLEAATRCIECTFTTATAKPDWNDFTFQKSVCQYVLKPLLDICPAKYR